MTCPARKHHLGCPGNIDSRRKGAPARASRSAGLQLQSLDSPVTNALHYTMPKQVHAKNLKQTACIHCGRCVSACPVRLQPVAIYNAVVKGGFAKAEKLWAKTASCAELAHTPVQPICPLPLTSDGPEAANKLNPLFIFSF